MTLRTCLSASLMAMDQHHYWIVSISAVNFEDSRFETSSSDGLYTRFPAANTLIPRCTRIELHDFANSYGRPENKNTLLGPVSGQEHQNCSLSRTVLRPLSLDVLGAAGGKAAPITTFLHTYKKALKYWHIFFRRGGAGGGEQLFADFYSSRRFLEPIHCQKRGMSVQRNF